MLRTVISWDSPDFKQLVCHFITECAKYSDSDDVISLYGNRYRSVGLWNLKVEWCFLLLCFPSTITNALSLMLLPKISAAKAENNSAYLRRCAILPIIFCLILGVGAWGGFFVLAP